MALKDTMIWLSTDGGFRDDLGSRSKEGATRHSVERAGKLAVENGAVGLFTLQFGEYRHLPNLVCEADECELCVCVDQHLETGDRRVGAVILEFSREPVHHWRRPKEMKIDDLYAVVFSRLATKRSMARNRCGREAAVGELQAAAKDAPIDETFGWMWFGQVEHRALHVEPGMGVLCPVVYRGCQQDGRTLRIVIDFYGKIEEWTASDESGKEDAASRLPRRCGVAAPKSALKRNVDGRASTL